MTGFVNLDKHILFTPSFSGARRPERIFSLSAELILYTATLVAQSWPSPKSLVGIFLPFKVHVMPIKNDISSNTFKNKCESFSKTVASNIAAYRKKCGMTQSEVGRLLNVEKETVSRIESGRISVNIHRLQEFACIFNCSIYDLIADTTTGIDEQALNIASIISPLSKEEKVIITRFIFDAVNMLTLRSSSL